VRYVVEGGQCDYHQTGVAVAENVRISGGRCHIISKGLKIHYVFQQIIPPVLTQEEWTTDGQLGVTSDNSPNFI
jgi:hypothetical protein